MKGEPIEQSAELNGEAIKIEGKFLHWFVAIPINSNRSHRTQCRGLNSSPGSGTAVRTAHGTLRTSCHRGMDHSESIHRSLGL